MDAHELLDDELRQQVEALGQAVTPADVDTYGRLRQIEDRSFKLRTIVEAWERQHNEERKLRRNYATGLIVGLFAQVAFVDFAFLAIGFEWITVERWVATTFLLAVFGEVAAMCFVVVKYLFPGVGGEIVRLIEKL